MDILATALAVALLAGQGVSWPREARDASLVECAVSVGQGAQGDNDKVKRVAAACICVQEGLESIMTAGQMYDLNTMPEDKVDAHPLTKQAAPIMDGCLSRYGLE